MVAFRILRTGGKVHSKLTTPDFKRADFCLFGICLVEYNGLKPCKEEGSKDSGCYSRITSSKLRSDEFQQRGRKVKTPGGLRGLKRSSWTNINTKRKPTMEATAGGLGGIQRDCVSHQRSG